MNKKLQCENCHRAEYNEELYEYDGGILCRPCIVARVTETSIPCEYIGTCNDKTYKSKDQQIAELKAENERLMNNFDELNSKYCSEMEKCISLQQQLKEKDELILRLRKDHKDEMHQLYVNLDAIAKQEERKQVCEKIRTDCIKEESTIGPFGVNESYYVVYESYLDQIEKGEDNAEKSNN